jgi:CHAT domain-containing protein
LPFEALRDADGYLISKFEFVYLPSASIYRYLTKGRGSEAITAPRLLAFADPDTDYNADGKPDMPPLPHARIEVAALAPRFATREVLVGREAQKAACLAMKPQFDVMHYACHGEFYPGRPWESALFLAPRSVEGSLEDGRLRAAEVFAMDLRSVRLVALSGCETGRGLVSPGDDVVSMAASFLHAGAPSLLVSLWRVEDEATSRLMRGFYENWLEKGMDKSRALREAKLALLGGEFRHPRQWAGFILVGEP